MSHKKSEPKRLLTHSTILIMSGFLIGLVASDTVPAHLQLTVLLAGVAGVVAYLGLGCVAKKVRTRAAQKLVSTLERRMDQHIQGGAPVNTERPARAIRTRR